MNKKLVFAVIIVLSMFWMVFCLETLRFVAFYGFVPISEFRLSDWTKVPSLFKKSIDIPKDGFSDEEDMIEFAYSQLNMDESFKLCNMRGHLDANGNIIGTWEVSFGKMIGSKPLQYFMKIDMDEGVVKERYYDYTRKSISYCNLELESIYAPFADQLPLILEYSEDKGINKDEIVDLSFNYHQNSSEILVRMTDSRAFVLTLDMLTHEIDLYRSFQ